MECEEFILLEWSPPDDPARPCRPWPSGDDDDGSDHDDDDDDGNGDEDDNDDHDHGDPDRDWHSLFCTT